MNKLLLPLISVTLINGFYHIIYTNASGGRQENQLREEYATVRFDTSFDSETYDPLSDTLHLSPGRFQ
jgi:hypothetical protein